MAAELEGDAGEPSNMGQYQSREAQMLSFGEENASPGAPTKRLEKLVETARKLPEMRKYVFPGRRLRALRRADLSFACLSSGLKFWGLSCDLNLISFCSCAALTVLWRSPFFLAGGPFVCISRTQLQDAS